MSKPRISKRDHDRIEFAREQRKQANEFSHDVWQMLRAGRMLGEKFKREYPLDPYTLDFVCLELKLNIEVDGKDHLTEEGKKHDAQRDAFLKERGYSILRIAGFRVTQDPLGVRDEIAAMVRGLRDQNTSSQLMQSPSPRSGARGAREFLRLKIKLVNHQGKSGAAKLLERILRSMMASRTLVTFE